MINLNNIIVKVDNKILPLKDLVRYDSLCDFISEHRENLTYETSEGKINKEEIDNMIKVLTIISKSLADNE